MKQDITWKVPELIKRCKDNPAACKVMMFLMDSLHEDSVAVVCSYKVFEAQLGLSQATVARALNYLRANGVLDIFKTGSTNVYVFRKELIENCGVLSCDNRDCYWRAHATILFDVFEVDACMRPEPVDGDDEDYLDEPLPFN